MRAFRKFKDILNTAALVVGCAVIAPGMGGTISIAEAPNGQGAAATTEPDFAGAPVIMRRLTEQQYRNTIAATFGSSIKVEGRFEPDMRMNGLIEVGSGVASISAPGFEQYLRTASDIAGKVTSSERRVELVDCPEAAVRVFDTVCATRFLERTGSKLFRRPLARSELASVIGIAKASAAKLDNNSYEGLRFALVSLLTSPNFLFRIETTESDPAGKGRLRLDGYSKASKLSFFLTDSPPDDELFRLAASGQIHRAEVLQAQVDRLMNGPLFTRATRTFFSDLFGFDGFEVLTKDSNQFPAFDQAMKDDAEEQTLLSVIDQLIVKDGDYRGLFTRDQTYLTRRLGGVYGVPVVTRQGWEPYGNLSQIGRAGILTEPSFLALHSHSGRSSPTLRGKFIRETFMCQHVPQPPANVNFSAVEDDRSTVHRTARERLTVHRDNPTCNGCHLITDPIGLALENFHTDGSWRESENGASIDSSGDIDGVAYKDAIGLGRALAASPEVPQCLVSQVYRYGVGREVQPIDQPLLTYYEKRFADEGYRYKALVRAIATSRSFYTAAVAPKRAPVQKIAKADLTRGSSQ